MVSLIQKEHLYNYSPRNPVNITFQGAAARMSHIFCAVVYFKVQGRYFVLFDVHM